MPAGIKRRGKRQTQRKIMEVLGLARAVSGLNDTHLTDFLVRQNYE
jgi:hypothetical protein